MSISNANPSVATFTRYRYVATGGETSVSGADANGSVMSYSPGREQVYLNGTMLVRAQDYAATTGSSITGLTALVANDVVEVLAFTSFAVAAGVAQDEAPSSPAEGQLWLDTNGSMADGGNIALETIDAKGDLIVGTADNAVNKLASSGVNGDVLTVDTSTSTGLKWAAPQSTGITWTVRKNSGEVGLRFRTIAYNGTDLYVAAGDSGNLWSSPDGKTWTSRTSGFGAQAIYKVIYANSIWVAVGANGIISTSSDGITWTARTANMGTNSIYSVHYANSLFVAVGEGGGTTNTGGITYSSDGITWTRKSQSLTVGAGYNDVTWNGTNWIVVAQLSTNNYLYATTPSGTWTAANAPGAGNILWILYDGTRTVYANNNPTVWYNTDTTLASSTAYSSYFYGTEISNKTFYDGDVYYLRGGYVTIVTLTSTNYPTSKGIFLEGGLTYGNTGISNGGTAIFAGAAGLITANPSGQIHTSF